jgi:hypothetical protein
VLAVFCTFTSPPLSRERLPVAATLRGILLEPSAPVVDRFMVAPESVALEGTDAVIPPTVKTPAPAAVPVAERVKDALAPGFICALLVKALKALRVMLVAGALTAPIDPTVTDPFGAVILIDLPALISTLLSACTELELLLAVRVIVPVAGEAAFETSTLPLTDRT